MFNYAFIGAIASLALVRNIDGSLMTQNANSHAGSVSNYELNAVYKAQNWKLEADSSFPDYPEQDMLN
jgi:hypothetical protein